MLASLLFRLQKRLVQLLDFFGLALWLGTGHAKCLGLVRMLFLFFLVAGRFDLFRRCAKVALDLAFFFLRGSLSKDIFVLRVRLRKVIEAEPLREFQFAAA